MCIFSLALEGKAKSCHARYERGASRDESLEVGGTPLTKGERKVCVREYDRKLTENRFGERLARGEDG